MTVNNEAGVLCGHYPLLIPILENEKAQNQNNGTGAPTIYENICDTNRLPEMFTKARLARYVFYF